MNDRSAPVNLRYQRKPKTWSCLALITFIILICYINTFNASWHLDDYSIIVDNPNVQINSLTVKELYGSFFLNSSQKVNLYRPLSMLSFAVNWYIGNDSVIGYHIFNIIVHVAASIGLFFSIIQLGLSPNNKNEYRISIHFVALLASVLWAINPIQTQAITYIVQRMASLSAMFYIWGIYFYLKGRKASFPIIKIQQFLFCFLCYIAACASKENAIMLPMTLLLIEVVFFQNLKGSDALKRYTTLAIFLTAIIILVASIMLKRGITTDILMLYDQRPFSMTERFLTESRVLLLYLSLIYYPVSSRFSIEHDIGISNSFFTPWTTSVSFLLILIMIILSLCIMKKKKWISFSILFFFINHIIESTFLPLELVFEHRNYLPSMFIFVPLSILMFKLIEKYNDKFFPFCFIIIFIISLTSLSGISTYIRNQIWNSEITLWKDALIKSPNRARPYQSLGIVYHKSGDLSKASFFYRKAFEMRDPENGFSQMLSLNNMAMIYDQLGNYKKSIELYKKALEVYKNEKSDSIKVRRNLVMALSNNGEYEIALEGFESLFEKIGNDSILLNLKATLLLKLNRPKEALTPLRLAIKKTPENKDVLLNISTTMYLMGYFEKALWFIKRANHIFPDDIDVLLSMSFLSAMNKNKSANNIYANQLIASYSFEQVANRMKIPLSHNRCFVIPSYTMKEWSKEMLWKKQI